jgi:O-antigen/teichoic acid export membrane protein
MGSFSRSPSGEAAKPYESPRDASHPGDHASSPSLKRKAVWVVACRSVGIGATMASSILVARLLGPGEYGTYLLVTTVMSLGGLIAMGGLNEAALRFISESLAHGNTGVARAYLRRALVIAAAASLVACLTVTTGLSLLGWAKLTPQFAVLLSLVGVGLVVLGWQQLGAELVRAYGDLRIASLFSGGQAGGPVSNLIFLAGMAIAAAGYLKLNAVTAIGLLVVSVCVTCPVLYGMLMGLSRPAADEQEAGSGLSVKQKRELLAVAGVLLVNQLLAFATLQIDIWLAGGLLSTESLGLYGAAKRTLLTAAMPVQMAMLTIVSSIPRLYARQQTTALERLVRGAATAAAIPSLAAIALLMLFPRQLLTLVLGSAYAAAAPILMVMAVGHVVLVLSGNPQHLLTMTGRHRPVLMVNLLSAAVLIVAGAIGARWFGAVGLAAASAGSLIVQNGWLWALARRDLGIWTHVGRFSIHQSAQEGISAEFAAAGEPLPGSST